MPILGVIASSTRQGLVTDTGVMFPIGAVTVGSAGASSITFSSIPATYTHLQVRIMARQSEADTTSSFSFRVNGSTDGADYYRFHYLLGNGSTVSAGASDTQANIYGGGLPAANSGSNIFGVSIIDILDYKNTNKAKTIRTLNGTDKNGSGDLYFLSGLYIPTTAISSLTFLGATSFAQYSSFALYGIKGA